MFAVEFNNVSFSYYNESILSDVTFQIPENEFAVIIGANGGGKSTLLKLILGLIQPSSGSIKVLGRSIKDSCRNIGYVPQDSTHMKNFPITVIDVVKMGFFNSSASAKEQDHISSSFLEKLNMLKYKDKRIRELSTGQRQKVFLARALVSSPELIILDEPISGVDPSGQKLVLDLLGSYRGSATILFVSHDLDIIPSYATSVICVNRSVFYHNGGELPENIYAPQGQISIPSVSLVKHECKCAQ